MFCPFFTWILSASLQLLGWWVLSLWQLSFQSALQRRIWNVKQCWDSTLGETVHLQWSIDKLTIFKMLRTQVAVCANIVCCLAGEVISPAILQPFFAPAQNRTDVVSISWSSIITLIIITVSDGPSYSLKAFGVILKHRKCFVWTPS